MTNDSDISNATIDELVKNAITVYQCLLELLPENKKSLFDLLGLEIDLSELSRRIATNPRTKAEVVFTLKHLQPEIAKCLEEDVSEIDLVEDWMDREIQILGADETFDRADQLFRACLCRYVVAVGENGKLVGIISINDVMKLTPETIKEARSEKLGDLPFLTRKPRTIMAHDTMTAAHQKYIAERVKALLVLDERNAPLGWLQGEQIAEWYLRRAD